MKTSSPAASDIRRKITQISERRDPIIKELQVICAERQRGGSVYSGPPLLDEDEKAARAHALNLLGDIAPNVSIGPDVSRERELFREQRGIAIAVKVLEGKLDEANAAATAKWWKAEALNWSGLIREAVLAKVRLAALDQRAFALFAGVDTIHLPKIPMGQFIGIVVDTPIHELTAEAVEAGIVSRAEIGEAELGK